MRAKFSPVRGDAGKLLSVVVHSHEADVENVHETVPKASYLGAACLSVSVRLQVEDTFRECREKIFHLALAPTVHLPRLNEFLCQVGEEIAQFP